MPLVGDFHRLALCADRGVGRRFFRCDRKLLVLELRKGHSPDRDQAHFLEAFETLENRREVVLVDIAGDVLQEERLVGSYVFVGNSGCSGFGCARLLGGDWVGLRFRVFFGALEVYGSQYGAPSEVVGDAHP